jgi:hypothetical protein
MNTTTNGRAISGGFGETIGETRPAARRLRAWLSQITGVRCVSIPHWALWHRPHIEQSPLIHLSAALSNTVHTARLTHWTGYERGFRA